MTRWGRRALVAVLPLLLAGPAGAQGLDLSKGGPVEITSREGIEWRQHEQVVIARGDARAVRGDVTVTADTLVAHYRKKAGAPAQAAAPPGGPPTATPAGFLGGSDTGSNEIYRLEADGHVRIFNATDLAVGDHAIYDIDQAVLLLTGSHMSLTTPTDVLTARDSMEYWSAKHMAVGRGLASVTTSDGRRLTADVLVGYTNPATPAATPGPAGSPPPAPGRDPLASGGKLQRVEAFGHVEARTATETVTGDRGVYVADTGIARIVGHVEVTRGQNHAVGDEALVNMTTGVSTLVRAPGQRVEGVIVPGETGGVGPATSPKPDAKPGAKPDAKPAARPGARR